MANYADKQTDIKLAEMEKRIAGIYSDSAKDLEVKWNQYKQGYDEIVNGKLVHHKGLEERYAEEYKAYQDGKYTKAQFEAWYYAQVGRGERWEALKDDMATRMTNANKIAAAYINDKTPGIYSLNANYTAYEIEKGTGIAFDLVNEQAVKRLMEEKNHSEFRVLSVNPKRDYAWNKDRIQKGLLAGVLQGESVGKIANRFLTVMGQNENAAIRNARTAVTSAQNGGRQDTFNRAEDMGIEIEKEWIATSDSRTRDSHRELDGVTVPNKEPFPNGCEYPGDPAGAPEEVYNCRCTMRAILPRYNKANRTDKTAESYLKWLDDKMKQGIVNDVHEPFVFEPASDIKEVKARMSDALGLDESLINLGKMDVNLANQYLDGVETFVNDFPQIKGLYTSFDTKVGGSKYGYVFGVNKLEGRMIRIENNEPIYKCTNILAFKSPQKVSDLMAHYEHGIATKQCYENAGPKSTAIHELIHGLDWAVNMKEHGYFDSGVLQTVIPRSEWHDWSGSIASQIIKDTKMEMFGKIHGKEVYDGISYLGSYALTDAGEMLAEAVSYEYINKSNPYSAKVLEKFKERVNKAFK